MSGGERKQEQTAKERQMVVFRLGREEFGVPILQTRGIYPYPKVTSLPQLPDFIEGVFDLQGEIIPVVDLRRRFGLPELTEGRQDSRVLVVELDGVKLGLVVDTVTETVWVAEKDIQPPPAAIAGIHGHYLAGLARRPQGLLILLAPERILTEPEREQAAAVGRTPVPGGGPAVPGESAGHDAAAREART